MNILKSILFSIVLIVFSTMMYGCVSQDYVVDRPTNTRGVTTKKFDFQDYKQAAQQIAQEMLKAGLPEGYIVALGPIDTKRCKYNVDVEQLQDRLAEILLNEGTLQFVSAIDLNSGNKAAAEIFRIIEYNYFNNNPTNPEDLKKYGKLATINGILFGSVHCQEEEDSQSGGTEINSMFSWKLTDTETGIDKCRSVYDIRKFVK